MKSGAAFGLTQSERELNELVRKSFLNLWSFSNLYIDKRYNGGTGQGKELCDILVICGDDVLIFSDKSVEWPSHSDIDVQWKRWKRKAIDKSVDQIRGAARWIREHPDRIFLDSDCTERLPLDLPDLAKMRIHGIVVARGSGEACLQFHGEGSASLVVHSNVPDLGPLPPFWISDPGHSDIFVHVLDDSTLAVLLGELDTVLDFVSYLDEKKRFFSTDKLVIAHGEEEILAAYLQGMNPQTGEHEILADLDMSGHDSVMLQEGLYDELRSSQEYRSRLEADKVSYSWDGLIEHFSKYILSGEILTISPGSVETDVEYDFKDHERGVREMARRRRVERRMLSQALISSFHSIKEKDRFFRFVMVAPTGGKPEIAFAFLVLKNNENTNPGGNHEKYREIRSLTLYAYCLNLLMQHSEIERIIGLGFDLPKQMGGADGHSEDLLFLEQEENWSEVEREEAKQLREGFGILLDSTLKYRYGRDHEFPEDQRASPRRKRSRAKNAGKAPYTFVAPTQMSANTGPNRKERRKANAEQRRAARRKK